MIQPSDSQSEVVPLTIKHPKNNHDNDGDNENKNGNDKSYGGDMDVDISESVTAIAKCGSTLELHALNDEESFSSAKQMLGHMLPVYGWLSSSSSSSKSTHMNNDGDVEMSGTAGDSGNSETATNKTTDKKGLIFDDLPFAKSQCQAAWVELCAFVLDDQVFRPSAKVKLELWKRILEGCILHSIDLEKQFLVRDLWKAVLGEDNDDNDNNNSSSKDGEISFCPSLFHAVIRRLQERAEGSSDVDTDSGLKCSSSLYVLQIKNY